MCELGIGGFMGVEDLQPGMKFTVTLEDSSNYHGDIVERTENTLTVSLDNFPPITKTTECELQVTVGNVLYHWKRALITKDSQIIIESRPKINNRRKYPRADLSNTCSITIANTSADASHHYRSMPQWITSAPMDLLSNEGSILYRSQGGRHPCYDP